MHFLLDKHMHMMILMRELMQLRIIYLLYLWVRNHLQLKKLVILSILMLRLPDGTTATMLASIYVEIPVIP